MERSPDLSPNGRDKTSALTERQRQCVQLVSKGWTSKQIARSLNISPSTVDNHVRAAITLLGVSSRIDAARIVTAQDGAVRTSDETASELDDSDSFSSKQNLQRSTRPKALHLPPFGGIANKANISDKFKQVSQVAILGLMLFSALIATIAGLISLFPR